MAAGSEVYVLGGYQTDFARNWTKENKHFSALMRESVHGALEATQIAPEEVEKKIKRISEEELEDVSGGTGGSTQLPANSSTQFPVEPHQSSTQFPASSSTQFPVEPHQSSTQFPAQST